MDIDDGSEVTVKGSGARSYALRNVGGVYSCTCPAWRNQGVAIERRTCKHLKKYRGAEAEALRLGADFVAAPAAQRKGAEAPPLLLAESWQNDVDLTGWWMSEKLDGVRAFWNGTQLVSRLGNRFFAPAWFVEGLPPDCCLDGELWGGRKLFQRTVSVVRRQDASDHWKELAYVVFDVPEVEGPFEARRDRLSDVVRAANNDYLRALDHQPCRGVAHMREELARVEALGGEGLMLREPGSHYVQGRSGTLLKVKTFHDREAVVVGHIAGKGRHKGHTGALEAELPDGTRFSVGTGLSDAERRSPPPLGAVITFRYQELSKTGVPRFPSYVRIRDDDGPAPRAVTQPAKRQPTAAMPQPTGAMPKAAASSSARYFELVDGKAAKFWEITLVDQEHRVRYGRLGTDGQSLTKSFASAAAATSSADKLVAAKVAKGYREVARP